MEQFNKTIYTISDNGTLLLPFYQTQEAAENAIDEMFDDDDKYLVKIIETTEKEYSAILTINFLAEEQYKNEILKAIQDPFSLFSESKDFLIDQLELLDDSSLSKEYFDYLIKNELQICNNCNSSSDEPDSHFEKTITYKDFLGKKILHIQELINLID